MRNPSIGELYDVIRNSDGLKLYELVVILYPNMEKGDIYTARVNIRGKLQRLKK